jgi:hypothetical protein
VATLPRAVLLGVALLIAWRVLHVNAIAYGETNRPELRLPAAGEPPRPALERALAANPARVEALVLLGVEHDRAGDPQAAARAFASALEVAPIDRASLRAAAVLDAREGRVAAALGRLDALLTYYGDAREWAFPLLLQWLAVPEGAAALEALAARPSNWMGAFLAHSCGKADPTRSAALLVRRTAAGQARNDEVACVLEGLRRAGNTPAAYQLWLNTLPRERLAEVGYVFNGSFEYTPTGLGFDWIADTRSPAHAVDYPLATGAAGPRVLRVTWSGKRVSGPAIHQFVALAPGRYKLTGLARMEGLQSVRGIQWTLRCIDERRSALGVSPRFLGSGDWETFAFEVDVPARCPGQVLQLEPVGLNEGTTFVSGKAWFDDLRATRTN